MVEAAPFLPPAGPPKADRRTPSGQRAVVSRGGVPLADDEDSRNNGYGRVHRGMGRQGLAHRKICGVPSDGLPSPSAMCVRYAVGRTSKSVRHVRRYRDGLGSPSYE